MSRQFHIYFSEIPEINFGPGPSRMPSSFIISDEAMAEVLEVVARDVRMFSMEDGKLRHPDD